MLQFPGQIMGKGKSGHAIGDKDAERLKEIPPEQKVWIGGLSGSGITWKQLQAHFNQVSKTIYSVVFENKGTGCVAYKSALEVQQAMMLNGTAIGNTVIQVDVWTKPEQGSKVKKKSSGKSWGKSRGSDKTQAHAPANNFDLQTLVKQLFLKQQAGGSAGGSKQKAKGKQNSSQGDAEKLKSIGNSLKVWVGGLTKEVTWKQLEDHFKQAGQTTCASVSPKKGHGVVAFKTEEEAQLAIASLNGSILGTCALQVDVYHATAK